MSGVPLETCWAFNKLGNNKFYYKAASCWYFYWVIYDVQIHEYQIVLLEMFSILKNIQWKQLMQSNLTECLLLPVNRRLFHTALLEMYLKWTHVTELISSKIWGSTGKGRNELKLHETNMVTVSRWRRNWKYRIFSNLICTIFAGIEG
jgi:hypothetical protein